MSVTLSQGQSISLATGKVDVAGANHVRYIDRGPWHGLDANHLDTLANYLGQAIKVEAQVCDCESVHCTAPLHTT